MKKLKVIFQHNYTNGHHPAYKISFGLMLFLFCIFFWPKQSTAQSYLQARIGYVTGQYRPLDKNLLDHDEHDFLGGALVDLEIGRELKNKQFSLLIGGRLQFSQRVLQGIYTENTWNEEPLIKANISALFLTIGGKLKITNRFSALLQANLGPSYILWYEDGDLKNSLWRFYLPIDGAFEYLIKNDLSITAGVSMIPPIYLSSTVNYCLGIRKEF